MTFGVRPVATVAAGEFQERSFSVLSSEYPASRHRQGYGLDESAGAPRAARAGHPRAIGTRSIRRWRRVRPYGRGPSVCCVHTDQEHRQGSA